MKETQERNTGKKETQRNTHKETHKDTHKETQKRNTQKAVTTYTGPPAAVLRNHGHYQRVVGLVQWNGARNPRTMHAN
mgnify:CR=1 FL=1